MEVFLLRRFILPYFHKGCVEVHLLFDNVGEQVENPKIFEQARRDSSSTYASSFFTTQISLINGKTHCHADSVTIYVSKYMVSNIQPLLRGSQKFVTSQALEPMENVCHLSTVPMLMNQTHASGFMQSLYGKQKVHTVPRHILDCRYCPQQMM